MSSLTFYSPFSHLSIVRAPTRQPNTPRLALVTGSATEAMSLVTWVSGKHCGVSTSSCEKMDRTKYTNWTCSSSKNVVKYLICNRNVVRRFLRFYYLKYFVTTPIVNLKQTNIHLGND